MATSQNGWPVVTEDKIDNTPILGARFPRGFLKGDVYKAFTWLFTQLNNRVEPIENGLPRDEWGYNVRKIEGSDDWSNHSSGTAGDYNARYHPMGVRNTYSEKDRDEIRQILREAGGLFRWGGNFSGRPDDMHFEIVKGPEAVHDFVLSISPKGQWKMTVILAGLALPTLMEGDDDNRMAGYGYVRRAQTLLNLIVHSTLKIDGQYGPATVAAVKKLASNANGKTIGLAEWRQLYGLIKVN